MRKTLVVLAVVTSVLLLQAPAWAPTPTTRNPNPKLYIVQLNPTATGSTRTVDISSDACDGQLAVTFDWGEKVSKKTAERNNTFQVRARLADVPDNVGTIDVKDVKSATCDGKPLPFTGAASTSVLVLGLSLLVIGALLVLSGRRRPLMRRG